MDTCLKRNKGMGNDKSRANSSRAVFPFWRFLACSPALDSPLINITLFLSIQGFHDLVHLLFLGHEGHIPIPLICSLLKVSLFRKSFLLSHLSSVGDPFLPFSEAPLGSQPPQEGAPNHGATVLSLSSHPC